MSRLSSLFNKKNARVLNVYCTAGFPKLNSTLEVMESLQANGADIIEVGMPYSDPLADGEVIQSSSLVALENGMTLEILFEQLAEMRKTIQVPVILMGYMNPILQYGFERFCAYTVFSKSSYLLPFKFSSSACHSSVEKSSIASNSSNGDEMLDSASSAE